jgi:ABC-type lipoprotein release transport system permease subunit
VLSGFLNGVRPSDPLTLAGVTALLFAVAFAACWFPARRASRVPPHVVLKSE